MLAQEGLKGLCLEWLGLGLGLDLGLDWKSFVVFPDDTGTFCKFPLAGLEILNPHPENPINLLGVDADPILLRHSPGNEEVGVTAMGLELDGNVGVHLAMDVDTRFLLHFSGRAFLGRLMLIPFSLGEAQLVADSYHEHLGILSVEDDGSADGFVLLDLEDEATGVDADTGWGVVCQFGKKLAPLLLPVVWSGDGEYVVEVVVEGLLGLVGQAVGVLQFCGRQVGDKLSQDALEQTLLVTYLVHDILMSELFKGKESRISIFQDWNIISPLMKFAKDLIPQQTKPEQIQRAEDLLNYAELLHANVHSFLDLKEQLGTRVTAHRLALERLLQQIYDLNSNRTQNVEEQDRIVLMMRAILQELYRELRGGRVIERQIGQFFQNANLANYNPHVHQLRFSNNSETQQVLSSKLEQIRRVCRSLFRSIHNQQEKLASVFSKDEDLHYCFQTLQELVSHDSLVRVHANMICQLKEVDDLKAQLMTGNRAAEAEYAKYELIYDCLELMKNEKEEIEREKRLLEDNFGRAGRYIPVGQGFHPEQSKLGQEESVMRESMGQGLDSENLIENNLKVYRTNLQNFTRVSAETSLYCYSYRQAQFVEALSDFEQYFERWKRSHSHLAYLFDQRSSLQGIKQQQTARSTFSEGNRQHLVAVYEEVRNRELGRHLVLQSYRRSLLTDFEKELQAQRMNFSQREIRGEDIKSVLVHQEEFFQKLNKIQTREKVHYLRTNKETIDQLLFELQPLELHSKKDESYQSSVELYSSALAFAKIISYNEDYHYQQDQFDSLMSQGRTYRELPHGMTDLVLAYLHDLNVVLASQAESRSFGGSHMEQFLDSVEGAMRDKKGLKIDEAVQTNLYRLGDYWLSLHHGFYRYLTPLGEELMLDELLQMGEEIGRRIHQSVLTVTDIPEIVTRSMDIDRSFFYTYRVLLALVEMTLTRGDPSEVQKFRILNLEAVLEATFQYLDTFFLDKAPSYKASDLIKLTLLECFFNRVYRNDEYARMVRAIRLQVYLQFMAEAYILNFEDETIRQNWLQPLLGIHFRMGSMARRMADVQEKQVSKQVYALLESIRRYPLTFTNKHDVGGFHNALRSKQLIVQLREVQITQQESISGAAITRVALQAIQEAEVMVETGFDLHENVMIRAKKEAMMSFQQIRDLIEEDIRPVNDKEPLQRHFQDSKASVTLQQGIGKLLGRGQ